MQTNDDVRVGAVEPGRLTLKLLDDVLADLCGVHAFVADDETQVAVEVVDRHRSVADLGEEADEAVAAVAHPEPIGLFAAFCHRVELGTLQETAQEATGV